MKQASAIVRKLHEGNPFTVSDYPYEGMRIGLYECGDHAIGVRYFDGAWHAFDERKDGAFTLTRHTNLHRAVVVALRRLRALAG